MSDQDRALREGLELFGGTSTPTPTVTGVFGATDPDALLARMSTVSQDDLGSDFFAGHAAVIDEQAREIFRDSLHAMADPVVAPAAPVGAAITASATMLVDPTPAPAAFGSASSASPEWSSTPVPVTTSLLTPVQREFVLYGPAGRRGAR